jgi:hypothetical protein
MIPEAPDLSFRRYCEECDVPVLAWGFVVLSASTLLLSISLWLGGFLLLLSSIIGFVICDLRLYRWRTQKRIEYYAKLYRYIYDEFGRWDYHFQYGAGDRAHRQVTWKWFSGVTSLDEAKGRYRELAKQHHPDSVGSTRSDSTRIMAEINNEWQRVQTHMTR